MALSVSLSVHHHRQYSQWAWPHPHHLPAQYRRSHSSHLLCPVWDPPLRYYSLSMGNACQRTVFVPASFICPFSSDSLFLECLGNDRKAILLSPAFCRHSLFCFCPSPRNRAASPLSGNCPANILFLFFLWRTAAGIPPGTVERQTVAPAAPGQNPALPTPSVSWEVHY